MIEVKNLSFQYGKDVILNHVNFHASPGEITAVIGANGVGKSTLLKCIAGLFHYSGKVLINAKDSRDMNDFEKASKIGYLCQNNGCDAHLTVFEVILMGLVNELSFHIPPESLRKAEAIMDLMNISSLAGRKIYQLSGGQQQLVFIAQTIIKEPEILIMDEPTSALDLNRQFHLMELIKKLTIEHKFTTIVCHHHLDLVSRYADQVVVLNAGNVYSQSSPADAFNEKMFEDVYGMNVEFYVDKESIRHMVPVNRIL